MATRINKIFKAYVGKQFSKLSVEFFGRWLISPLQRKEKEQELEKLWRDTVATATSETLNDLYQLKERVKPTYQLRWLNYAAAVAIIFISVSTTLLYKNAHPTTQLYVAEMCEQITQYGESKYVTLPDGTEVYLSPGSIITYPEVFSDTQRSVYLSGEARFIVSKDPNKRFTVNTHILTVEALGTIFHLKAYPDSSDASTILEEGSVNVSVTDQNNFSGILKPNEEFRYNKVTKAINITIVDDNSIKLINEGYTLFEQSDFYSIIESIERDYNVDIYYDKRKFENKYYTVKFSPNETIEEVMIVLKDLIDIKYKINDRRISIL